MGRKSRTSQWKTVLLGAPTGPKKPTSLKLDDGSNLKYSGIGPGCKDPTGGWMPSGSTKDWDDLGNEQKKRRIKDWYQLGCPPPREKASNGNVQTEPEPQPKTAGSNGGLLAIGNGGFNAGINGLGGKGGMDNPVGAVGCIGGISDAMDGLAVSGGAAAAAAAAAPPSVLASAPGDTYSFKMDFFDGHKADVFVKAGRYWCDAPGRGSIELRVLTDADGSLQYLCHDKKIVGMVPQDVIETEAPVAREAAAANGSGFGDLKDDRHPFYACDDSPDGSRKNPTPRQLHLNKPHVIEPTPPPLASGSLAGRPPGTGDATKPLSTVARSNPSTDPAMVAILQEQRRHNDMMDNWWVQQGQHNVNVNEKLINFGQTQREQGERLDDIEASNRERDANTDAQRSEFEARLGKLEDQGGELSDQVRKQGSVVKSAVVQCHRNFETIKRHLDIDHAKKD